MKTLIFFDLLKNRGSLYVFEVVAFCITYYYCHLDCNIVRQAHKRKNECYDARMLKIIFLLIQEDYPETRRAVKKLKTTHVNYQPSGQKQEIKPYVDKKPEEKTIQVTHRGEDLTYGRIETSRTLPSTYRREEPKAVERITVEEITFPIKTKSTSAETYQVRVSLHIHSVICGQQIEGKPPMRKIPF